MSNLDEHFPMAFSKFLDPKNDFAFKRISSEAELAQIAGSDKVIARAYEELNRFSWTDVELNT